MEADLLQLLGDYGIQTAMLVWFMWRTETVIKNNTEVLIIVRNMMNRLMNR